MPDRSEQCYSFISFSGFPPANLRTENWDRGFNNFCVCSCLVSLFVCVCACMCGHFSSRVRLVAVHPKCKRLILYMLKWIQRRLFIAAKSQEFWLKVKRSFFVLCGVVNHSMQNHFKSSSESSHVEAHIWIWQNLNMVERVTLKPRYFFCPYRANARSKMRSQCACLNSQLFTLVFTIYVVNQLDVKTAFICVRNLLCMWET